MIVNIENPDALRNWLTSTLQPICDADPAALAKYVMAILKKDKPEQDLKDFCVEQLDVFLQKETRPFVDRLFAAIKDGTYLAPTKPVDSVAPSVVTPTTSSSTSNNTVGAGAAQKPWPPGVTPTSITDSASSGRGGGGGGGSRSVTTSSASARPTRSNSRSGRKRSPSPSNHHRSTGGGGGGGNDHRSRSRSRDRTGGGAPPPSSSSSRSGGGGGSGDRRYNNNDQRQPVSSSSSSKDYPRRDPDKENRSNRSRKSPLSTSTPSTTTAIATGQSDSTRSKASTSRKTDRGDSDGGSNDGDKSDKKRKKMRCRDFDEKGFCMRGDLCPYDHGPDPVVVDDIALPTMISSKRLPPTMMNSGTAAKPPSTPGGTPNFAIPPPGYGTAPPGAHPPPPGMDSVPSYQAEGYNPEAPSIMAVPPPGYNRPPPPHGPPGAPPRHPPPIWTQQPPPSLYMTQPPNALGAPPGTSMPVPLSMGAMMVQRPGLQPPPSATGQTGSTVVVSAQDQTRTVIAAPVPMASTVPFRPHFGGKRPFGGGPGGQMGMGGPRAPAPYDKNNCTLEVRRIPSHLNTISKLNEHFAQFGHLVNMQVRYENDPEAALITFATRSQAVSAYKSTAPILNNRFVKIFWHDKESNPATATGEPGTSSGSTNAPSPPKPSIKDRLGAAPNAHAGDNRYRLTNNEPSGEDGNHRSVVLSTSGNLTRTVYNPEALAAASTRKSIEKSGSGSAPSTPPSPSVAGQKPTFPQGPPTVGPVAQQQQAPPPMVHPKMLRKQQKIQEAMKKSLELQRAKSDLVKKQLEQQKLLMVQYTKCTNAAQKKEILKTIKVLEQTIKSSTEDLSKAAKQSATPSTKSKEALEKEVLDTELELIRQKQSGGDTSDMQRRLNSLRSELTTSLAQMSMSMAMPSMGGAGGQQSGVGGGGAPGQAAVPGHFAPKKRFAPETAVLDKRPRNLSIGGFQTDEKDALIEHLQHYGMLEDIEFHHTKGDPQACRATVIYKTRREAETALANGAQFRERQLTIQWANQRQNSVSDNVGGGASGGVGGADGAGPNAEMTAEEMLASLDDDEEEEEEEEEEDGDGEQADEDEDEPSTSN